MDDHTERLNSELRNLQAIDARLRTPEAFLAQPDSDLSADNTRLPDIWATSVVQRSLFHAIECLTTAGKLILGTGWMHAPFVLLRGAYESAALAVWLLEPDSADKRLARLIVQHKHSWKYSKTAYGGTPLDDGGLHDKRQKYAAQMAKTAGVNLADGAFRGFEALIKSLDDFPDQSESLLTAWRLCSGVSHAKTWALTAATTEVRRQSYDQHTHVSSRTNNPGLATSLLSVGRRTVERAWVLCTIRTTSRPHAMQLELTALPLNTADGAH